MLRKIVWDAQEILSLMVLIMMKKKKTCPGKIDLFKIEFIIISVFLKPEKAKLNEKIWMSFICFNVCETHHKSHHTFSL